MNNRFQKDLPSKIFKKLSNIFKINLPYERIPTISTGWDQYAKTFEQKNGKFLGDEWGIPENMGIDVPREEVVSYIDKTIVEPHLGKCETILEIGPGGGRFTQILLPKCKRLIAADTSRNMLKLLKQRFPESNKIQYLLLDGHGLSSIQDISVDSAFSYDVFVHLAPWDIANYLLELKRVLKVGGKAIIHHGNTLSELGWKRFLEEMPKQLNTHKLPGTFTVMTPELIKEFVTRLGLNYEKSITNIAKRDCISLISNHK